MTDRRAYPFTQTVAGQTSYGIVFESEAERDESLLLLLGCGWGAEPDPMRSPEAHEGPRPRGRPAFDRAIAAAFDALAPEIELCATQKEAARLVQKAIAHTGADEPSTRTIERFLAERRERKGEARNRAKNTSVPGLPTPEYASVPQSDREFERPRRRGGKY